MFPALCSSSIVCSARSAAVGSSRVRKMKSRDELLETLKAECADKLSAAARSKNYADLMKKLIVQGLIKIEESVVEVQVRAEDVATANRVVSLSSPLIYMHVLVSLILTYYFAIFAQLPEAVNEFRALMTAAGHRVAPRVTVSSHNLPAKGW